MSVKKRFQKLFNRTTGEPKSINDNNQEPIDEIQDVQGNGFTLENIGDRSDPNHHNFAHDVAFISIGSGANFQPNFYDGIMKRKLESHSANLILGASATRKDGEGLEARKQEHSRFILSEGKGKNPTYHWVIPNSPNIIWHTLAQGVITGLASDPERAGKILCEHATFRADVDRIPEDIQKGFYLFRRVGGKLCWTKTFGGHLTLGKYIQRKTSEKIKVNFQVGLYLIPALDGELKSHINARGHIYLEVEEGVAPDELNIVVQNTNRGWQETDAVLADAVISLLTSGASGSELDGDSLTSTLRTYSNGWVEAIPTFADVPLAVEIARYRSGKDTWHNWRLGQEAGDQAVNIILARVGELLARACTALHVIVVTGYFASIAEIRQLKEFAHDLARALGCELILVVNHQDNPILKDSAIRYGITDFIAAEEGLPAPLLTPYRRALTAFSRKDTLCMDEFLTTCRPNQEELDKATRVRDLVEKLV